jgi:hypothetical protein
MFESSFESATAEIVPKTQLNKSPIIPEQTDLIILKGGFSTCDARYQFEIKSDGTGTIFYSEYGLDTEDFWHESDLAALNIEIEESVNLQIEIQSETDKIENSELENICREITTEKLEEFFWDEINHTLEDPFFRSFDDESEWGSEFSCENGSAAEMEAFLELCVLTEREIKEPDDYLMIDSETDCEAAGLSDCSYWSERLGELGEIACKYYKPVGHRYDYNDGWIDRYSGHSMNCESLRISLKESALTPAREKMLGMIRLRNILAEMDVESDVVNRLTAF